jgi:hypothetical protein
MILLGATLAISGCLIVACYINYLKTKKKETVNEYDGVMIR